MLIKCRPLNTFRVLSLALVVAVGQDPTIPSDQAAALNTFTGHFPEIQSTLEDDPCQWCGCITVTCTTGPDGVYQPNSLVIGRQLNIYASDYELLSNDSDDSYSSHTCPTYADCADDAFDVDLPPNAFAGLYLPGLTDFEISDSAGPGVEFLTGELPGNLPEAMPALQTLSVSGTGLGGAVPSAWFEPGVWEALSDLTLYNNSALTGPVPDLPSEALPALAGLSIENCSLSGSLPFIGPRAVPTADDGSATSLSIYLDGLGLTGTLPADFALGSNISGLDLSGNNLTGSLPASWGIAGHFGDLLESLSLADNQLTGQIPDTWGSQMDGQQTGEFRLDLSDNDLSGPIPAGFDGGGRQVPDFITVLPGNPGLCGPSPDGVTLANQYTYDAGYYDYGYGAYNSSYYDGSYGAYGNSSYYDYYGEGAVTLPPC